MNITPAPDVLKPVISIRRWSGVPEAEAQCTSSLVSFARSAIGRAELMLVVTAFTASLSEMEVALAKDELIRIGGSGRVGAARLPRVGDLARGMDLDVAFVLRIEATPAVIDNLLWVRDLGNEVDGMADAAGYGRDG
jgi:hypothetical protein